MAAVRALLLYGQAMALMMALQCIKRHQRPILLIPLWASMGLSFKDIGHILSFLGLNVCLVCSSSSPSYTARYCSHPQPRPWHQLAPLGFPAAYRRSNNPRAMPTVPWDHAVASTRRRLRFVAFSIVKIMLIVGSRTDLDRMISPYMATYTLHDFSPKTEWSLHRLLSGEVSARNIAIRTYVALSCIIETYSQLMLCHTVLGLVFVAPL
jgi:hypothetical protein